MDKATMGRAARWRFSAQSRATVIDRLDFDGEELVISAAEVASTPSENRAEFLARF